MIDVEIVMAQPFTTLTSYNTLRRRLLNSVVSTSLAGVQTREVVLRALNTPLGSIFARLSNQKKSLQEAYICEKRNVVDIEEDTRDLNYFFVDAAKLLFDYGLAKQHVDFLVAALNSNSVIMRVSGKCAVILLASFIEMDIQNA
jgi:hypothetical protein